MTILIMLFKFNLKFVYFFLKFFPINKNKIVFISRQSNKPSIDFELLKKELSNYEVVMLTKKLEGGLSNYIKYYFHIYRQMYHLATSKVCVLDSYCIPACILKHKKDLTIIQMWHAMGAIKQFGYQTIGKSDGRGENLSKLMCMHQNYNYILSGSQEMVQYFTKAFNVSESSFIVNGLPRIDYLLKNRTRLNKEIKDKYPELKNKQNILYVPTFRKNETIDLNKITKCIDFDKYNFIVKLHPKTKIDCSNKKIMTCPKFSSLELLTIADCVITDYSAISIEAASLDIPIFLYLYDYDDYSKNNGLNIDLFKELKPYVFKKNKPLFKKLTEEKYDLNVVYKFKEKYLDKDFGKYTKKLSDFIKTKMEN